MLKRAYVELISPDPETPILLSFVRRALALQPGRVVDIGCGYGRLLRPLHESGCDVLGVEANGTIAAANRAAGLPCVSPGEFLSSGEAASVMVMSHLIEHFAPKALLAFMDQHLDLLLEGGHLVIATPLLTPHFFDDFDHVRPYHPDGIEMVFGARPAQVQYASRNVLQLSDLEFRRSPWRATLARGLHLRVPSRRILQLANAMSALAFRGTFGWIGQKSGWIGLFRKSGVRANPTVAAI
jgi:SAM-dependent methyltransferase